MRIRSAWVIRLLAVFVCGFSALRAQSAEMSARSRFVDATIGLGASAHFASSVANYLNQVALPLPGQKVELVIAAPDFFAAAEFQLTDEWSAGLEYDLLIKSYSIQSGSGFTRTDASYQVHAPAVVMHRLVFGEGFRLKVGGGAGYSFCLFAQELQPYGSTEKLRSSGPGFRLEALGNTKFDETFFGCIAIDLRWDFMGRLSGFEGAAPVGRSVDLPTMTLFNAGIKFGLTFQLN